MTSQWQVNAEDILPLLRKDDFAPLIDSPPSGPAILIQQGSAMGSDVDAPPSDPALLIQQGSDGVTSGLSAHEEREGPDQGPSRDELRYLESKDQILILAGDPAQIHERDDEAFQARFERSLLYRAISRGSDVTVLSESRRGGTLEMTLLAQRVSHQYVDVPLTRQRVLKDGIVHHREASGVKDSARAVVEIYGSLMGRGAPLAGWPCLAKGEMAIAILFDDEVYRLVREMLSGDAVLLDGVFLRDRAQGYEAEHVVLHFPSTSMENIKVFDQMSFLNAACRSKREITLVSSKAYDPVRDENPFDVNDASAVRHMQAFYALGGNPFGLRATARHPWTKEQFALMRSLFPSTDKMMLDEIFREKAFLDARHQEIYERVKRYKRFVGFDFIDDVVFVYDRSKAMKGERVDYDFAIVIEPCRCPDVLPRLHKAGFENADIYSYSLN